MIDGGHVACQTWLEGRFVCEFTQSPTGKVASNNQRITFDLVNICQLDSGGKLIEEWVRTDNRSIFRQLGVSQD